MLSNLEINKLINENTCRACLQTKNEGCVSLKNKSELSQLFEFCVGLSVEPDDMSQVLCQPCTTIVKKFADFKVQCHTSDEMFKSIAKNKNNICTEKFSTIEEVNVDNYHLDNINFIGDEFSNDNVEINDNCNTKDIKQKSQSNEKVIEIPRRKSSRRKKCKNDTPKIIFEENKSNNEQCEKSLIKVLECNKCKKQYQRTKCLINHMRQTCYRHKNIKKAVVTEKYRQQTIKEKDEKTKKSNELFCGLCRFSSFCREDLVIHLNEHWNNNDLHCKLCSFVGQDIAELFGHRSVHQPYVFLSKLANRNCHICDKSATNIKIQQFHYRSVHLNKHGGLCSVCRKTFRSYTAWRNHERLHKEGKYICDLCGNKFLFRSMIEAHMAEHANIRDNICHICGKAFKRASYLKVHFNTVHIKEPVRCTHCDKTFKSPASLKDHLKYVNRVKKFQCDVCFKYFVSELSLKKHKFWHTEMRPFSCKDCGIKYKAKSYLKIHMRKHTGQRPYTCDQCDKCFPTSMQLKRHGMVHSGERPYKCSNCNRSFYYKKQLLRHINLKHKGEGKSETDQF